MPRIERCGKRRIQGQTARQESSNLPEKLPGGVTSSVVTKSTGWCEEHTVLQKILQQCARGDGCQWNVNDIARIFYWTKRVVDGIGLQQQKQGGRKDSEGKGISYTHEHRACDLCTALGLSIRQKNIMKKYGEKDGVVIVVMLALLEQRVKGDAGLYDKGGMYGLMDVLGSGIGSYFPLHLCDGRAIQGGERCLGDAMVEALEMNRRWRVYGWLGGHEWLDACAWEGRIKGKRIYVYVASLYLLRCILDTSSKGNELQMLEQMFRSATDGHQGSNAHDNALIQDRLEVLLVSSTMLHQYYVSMRKQCESSGAHAKIVVEIMDGFLVEQLENSPAGVLLGMEYDIVSNACMNSFDIAVGVSRIIHRLWGSNEPLEVLHFEKLSHLVSHLCSISSVMAGLLDADWSSLDSKNE